MARNRIIINHTGFSVPLRAGLEGHGLTPIFEDWAPCPATLENTLACFVWFYDCLRHPLRIWRLKRRLARHGVPLVAWNMDAPHYLNRAPWRLDLLDRARLLDIYATHTLIDARRRFAKDVLYLANAADPARYSPGADPDAALRRLRDPSAYRVDVSFFGGMNGARYKEDQPRADFFAALGKRLDALGISHNFRETDGMSVAEQVEFIQSSRINLNFGARCEFGAPVASGLPERCFGIPACGGFLLCDRRTHARDDFTPGENWAEFDGIDDCVNQISYWRENFAAARTLAEKCHRHVLRNHTYAKRAERLLNALHDWHAHRESRR